MQILDLSQIGIYAKDRREDAPFVIGGGPCTYNPEPLADFFDMFYIGESETVYYDLMDLSLIHIYVTGEAIQSLAEKYEFLDLGTEPVEVWLKTRNDSCANTVSYTHLFAQALIISSFLALVNCSEPFGIIFSLFFKIYN